VDADCEDGNGCTWNRCIDGTCLYDCVCGISYPGGGNQWTCCFPLDAPGCPPLPTTTTSTTIEPTPCEVAHCRWFRTCGDPVCRSPFEEPVPVPGVAACTTETEGAACTTRSARCDPGAGCGQLLLCDDQDPTRYGCPISRREFKRDVRYLSNADIERLRAELLRLRLARYRYASEDGPPERLGFMIDDVGKSPAVAHDGTHVDLYGYTSLAVAAIQAQARELEALRREVAELRARCEAPRRAGAR
jgi:hypothetical protein